MKACSVPVLLVLALFLGGCAGMGDDECRTGWFQLGERDALVYGLRPQIDQVAVRCSARGIQANEVDYMAGWRTGAYEHGLRVGIDGAE